jgi:hypothetical protein
MPLEGSRIDSGRLLVPGRCLDTREGIERPKKGSGSSCLVYPDTENNNENCNEYCLNHMGKGPFVKPAIPKYSNDTM